MPKKLFPKIQTIKFTLIKEQKISATKRFLKGSKPFRINELEHIERK